MGSSTRTVPLVPFPAERVPGDLRGAVVAIGNFDGVHRGHLALLDAAKREASRHSVPTVVLTFEPHPRTVLRPEAPVFRLTPLPAKARLMAAAEMTGLAVATFDRLFASMNPMEFIERVLVGELGVSGVVVGHDFRFGKGRAGSVATLEEAGRNHGFSVTRVDPVADVSGAIIASRDIRNALAAGEVTRANALLGHRWFVEAMVEHGDGRGRGLGFPTANLRLPADCLLRHGIYAVRMRRASGAVHDAVASFGIRPTFGGGTPLLEVHVFDFDASLYDEAVSVTFVGWIRPEAKFAGVPELVTAIHKDVADAKAMLAAAGPGSDLDLRLAAIP